MKSAYVLGALAAALPIMASAQVAPPPYTGLLSPYYTYSNQLQNGAPDHFSGSGVGVSGQLNLPYNLFVSGLYQWNNEFVPPQSGPLGAPGAHLDQRSSRIGGGMQFVWPQTPVILYGKIDYVDYGQTVRSAGTDYGHTNDDGTGYFGGVRLGENGFGLYAQGGYIELSDATGPEGLIGFDAPIGQRLKLFAEYRYNDFSFRNSGNTHLRFNDYHVGVRMPFWW